MSLKGVFVIEPIRPWFWSLDRLTNPPGHLDLTAVSKLNEQEKIDKAAISLLLGPTQVSSINSVINMPPTLLFAFVICYRFGGCYGAIDAGVTVVGTTVGPNYHRAEGIGRLQSLIPNRVTTNWNLILKHAYLVPRHTRTHARRVQSVPQKNAAMGCQWIFTAHAVQVTPYSATETQRLSAGRIRLLLTNSCLAHQNVNVQVVNAPCPIAHANVNHIPIYS